MTMTFRKEKGKKLISYDLCLLLWVDKLKKRKKKKNWCECERFQETSFPKISQAQSAHSWKKHPIIYYKRCVELFSFSCQWEYRSAHHRLQLFFFGKSQMQQNISFSLTSICHLNHPTHYTCDVSSAPPQHLRLLYGDNCLDHQEEISRSTKQHDLIGCRAHPLHLRSAQTFQWIIFSSLHSLVFLPLTLSLFSSKSNYTAQGWLV